MKKRLKSLEDTVAKLTDTNDALSGTIRVMRKEKAAARYDTNSDRGDGGDDEDDGVEPRSLMLFKSRNVRILLLSHHVRF